MMKISIVEGRTQRRLVLEGRLVAPWTAELRPACEKARADLEGRELVIVLKNLIAINQAGEHVLLQLMEEGVKLQGSDVFSKRILKELARRTRGNGEETKR